jgi:tetratricopeptide (TPR) repeat protein
VGIDLGSNSQIALSATAWDRLGLNHLATTNGNLMGLDGGVVETKMATVERASIGPIAADNIGITIEAKHPFAGDGIIGLGIFSHFDFAIDVAARKLWMSPVDSRATGNAFASDVQIAIDLYRSGESSEAVRRLSALDGRAKTPFELNILCWEKATSGIMLDSAVEQCRRAVDLSGREPSILDSLGFALLRSGKIDDALSIYSEAINKGQIAASYMGRAIAYSRKGDAARARADLEEATRRDPGIRDLFAGYGLIFRNAFPSRQG